MIFATNYEPWKNTSPRRPHTSCQLYNNQKHGERSSTLVQNAQAGSCFPSSHKTKSVKPTSKPRYRIISEYFFEHLFFLRATVNGYVYIVMLLGDDK